MPKCRKTVLPIVLLLYFLFSPGLANAIYPLLLTIEKMNGQELISIPIEPGENFTIRYIHSVDISPVYEVFYADEKKRIIIKETYFKMFGAGMGHWR